MAELVMDVGMHNGDDTAYYLESGYDVVAVEANPEKCALAAERFASEIASGRLEILNVGIGDLEEGPLKFWVSSESAWSSFDPGVATRRWATAIPIDVPVASFGDLLEKYGVPLFVKLDIEGYDSLCVRQICNGSKLSRFVSFEAGDDAAEDVKLLSEAGYRGFRCVRQNDWREITLSNVRRQSWIRRFFTRFEHGSRLHARARGLHNRALGRRYRPRRIKGVHLTPFASGPFPWTFSGPWRSAEQTREVWEFLHALDQKINALGAPYWEWFDIHAVLDP